MTDIKITLPRFLKLFTDNNVPVPKAMAIASKIYKEYNTSSKLGQLNEAKLVAAGIHNKDDRKLTMSTLRKTGHVPMTPPRKKLESATDEFSAAGPSTSTSIPLSTLTTPVNRKRRRVDGVNDLLPDGPVDEAANYGDLVFNEVLDEEILKSKSTIINRAPLMTAWATVVAERIGFSREEALSIASAYTEMNAVAKGVSLGIYEDGKRRSLEAIKGGSQSYVEFIGRRPLYRTHTNQWRALSNGSPVQPGDAFFYITRSFRQTTPYIIGSLKLLAANFKAEEISNKAWSLYAEFRPAVDQWGKRSEVKCSTILGLRKDSTLPLDPADLTGTIGQTQQLPGVKEDASEMPDRKRTKALTLEEYEAELDQDFVYNELDLSPG